MWVYIYSDGQVQIFSNDANFAQFLRDTYPLNNDEDDDLVIDAYMWDCKDRTYASWLDAV